jgi:hypothetical protein
MFCDVLGHLLSRVTLNWTSSCEILSCETYVVSVLSVKTSRDLWKLGTTRENHQFSVKTSSEN